MNEEQKEIILAKTTTNERKFEYRVEDNEVEPTHRK